MTSKLFASVDSPQLFCIALAVFLVSLQGCGTRPEYGRTLDPEVSTRPQAQALLREVREGCNAKCEQKCNYESGDWWDHAREAAECHTCLQTSCAVDLAALSVQIGQHWYEPVCQDAIAEASRCWTDVSQCVALETSCWTSGKGSCDFGKLDQCWLDYTTKCIDEYLPCCYKGESGSHLGSSRDRPTSGSGENQCVDNGTPGLNDGLCRVAHSWTPGRPVYAYQGTGSESWQGCCTQRNARNCVIYLPPGSPRVGTEYDCEQA